MSGHRHATCGFCQQEFCLATPLGVMQAGTHAHSVDQLARLALVVPLMLLMVAGSRDSG